MRKTECITCAWYYPGGGCKSEEVLACSCCYTPISDFERLTQIIDILNECLNVLQSLKFKFKEEQE